MGRKSGRRLEKNAWQELLTANNKVNIENGVIMWKCLSTERHFVENTTYGPNIDFIRICGICCLEQLRGTIAACSSRILCYMFFHGGTFGSQTKVCDFPRLC